MPPKSFQKQFEELEKIVASFEAGKFDLDEGLEKFEEELKIASELKKRLKEAENKLEQIKVKFSAETPAAHDERGVSDN